MPNREIILASSSETRRALMDRLGVDYRCISPDIDEKPTGETHADQLALRLAMEKAAMIAQQYPDAIVIGSDQVAYLAEQPQHFIGKPMSHAAAVAQLTEQSGQSVQFSTGLSVQCLNANFEQSIVDHFEVQFRALHADEIERYVSREQPIHCAGSFKCEGLGISLFERMHGNDQTTLMGLPMIALCKILRQLGLALP